MRASVAAAVSVLVLGAAPARPPELLVHAAASLRESLEELARVHEARTGVKVRLNLGASSALARQVLEGAPGDVFLSADEAKMDQLAGAGLVDAGSRRSLLANTLVVVVREHSGLSIATSADLAGPAVASVALADPSSVPAGIYAREHLERVGAWEAVSRKVVPTENVRAALAAVESGNVDAAMVYATDARVSPRVRVACRVPEDQSPDIAYAVARLAGSPHPAEAQAFLDLLASAEGARVFESHGFVVKGRAAAAKEP